MYVVTKSTRGRASRSVQLVASYRDGDNKPRQRVVEYIGSSTDDEGVKRLREEGERVKARLEDRQRAGLFPPETVARMAIEWQRRNAQIRGSAPNRSSPTGEGRYAVYGFYDVFGLVYRKLGLHKVLPPGRFRVSSDILFHLVMARIACPASKRDSVRFLREEFGIILPLQKVYRMMDCLDEGRIEEMRALVRRAGLAALSDSVPVVFFDCTTLGFETEREDELRQKGVSKDGKHGESQVLLALAVSRDGLPLGYRVLSGKTYEGHSLKHVLEDMRQLAKEERVVYVADRGMSISDNLALLDRHGVDFVVGARLRSLPDALQRRIVEDAAAFGPAKDGSWASEWEHLGRRLIVGWSADRAGRDAHARGKDLERLTRMMERGASVKEMISNRSKRFLAVEGTARMVDGEKIAWDALWDGLSGVATSMRDIAPEEAWQYYRGLWQVEESFRINKHDLRMRPIYHWSPARVRAHIAIAYMAYACVRHLAHRVSALQGRMSPERIRNALNSCRSLIYYDETRGKRVSRPATPNADARIIYEAMGIRLETDVVELD